MGLRQILGDVWRKDRPTGGTKCQWEQGLQERGEDWQLRVQRATLGVANSAVPARASKRGHR